MTLKPLPAKSLACAHDRAIARLAMRARLDTWNGGTRALVLADRMSFKQVPAEEIVAEVYAGGGGEFFPFACPECGQACLGERAALACCSFDDQETLEVEEEDMHYDRGLCWTY